MTDSDDTMAAKRPTKPVDDDTVAAKTAPASVEAETPEAFDFQEWLQGLAPAKAVYRFAGVEFQMQARTREWNTAREELLAEGATTLEQNADYLAGHIVAPEVTVADIIAMHESAAPEVTEMLKLAVDLDNKPRALISPRFLR